MQFIVLESLTKIQSRWPMESPKIIERLLAISFDPKRGGFEVESKSTVGVDICLVKPPIKYAPEVKTTSSSEVLLQEKDIVGLAQKYKKDGYTPCVVALRIDLPENWVVARASRLDVGTYQMARLALDSIADLEATAQFYFEDAVLEFTSDILNPKTGTPL